MQNSDIFVFRIYSKFEYLLRSFKLQMKLFSKFPKTGLSSGNKNIVYKLFLYFSEDISNASFRAKILSISEENWWL